MLDAVIDDIGGRMINVGGHWIAAFAGTFGAAAVAYLSFMGPAEVLLSFLVR
jgi:hypothetical protein